MKNEFVSGALLDTRTKNEIACDFLFDETVSDIAPVNWIEKPQDQWRHFPIFNQNGSGSCVAQTMAKLLGILYWLDNHDYVHFSATHIYSRRSNKPSGGMNGVEAFQIAQNGVTLEILAPSQNMTDQQMDGEVIPKYKQDVGSIFKIGNFIQVIPGNIETIASIIQTTGKAVMTWFYFEPREWSTHPEVLNTKLVLSDNNTCRHSVVAVDYTLVNGKKCLVIEDSWGTWGGFTGQRTIDEDFFKARNWFAAYPINFKFDDQTQNIIDPKRPHFIFNNDLYFGLIHQDVVELQNVLKYEGLFPNNISSTGYFGAITKVAVQKFQEKHGVVNSSQGGYGRVGAITRGILNSLYGK